MSLRATLREQGRGVAGGLLVVGLAFLYTSEAWWLGYRLPIEVLTAYAAVGLVGVLVVARQVGFRASEADRGPTDLPQLAIDASELVIQSFLAAYVVLLLFGVLRLTDAPATVVRLGLITVVPVAIGAALANRLLSESGNEIQESSFPRNIPTFALGALFVTVPVAPTREVAVIAATANWPRLAAVVLASVAVAHLVLHELEFRGHSGRIADRSGLAQLGTAAVVYVVGVGVSVILLAAYGHFSGAGPLVWVQKTIVLGFLAAAGASAGEVVL